MRNFDPIWFAPQRKLGGGWICFKSSPSAPPAPDYVGAANAQGVANKDSAIATAQLSNPNVSNWLGTQNVSYANDPTTGNPIPTVTQKLAPEQQSLYDSQTRLSNALSGVGERGLSSISNTLQTPIDASSGAAATDKAYQQFKSRLDPQWAQNDQLQASNLANQGITQGSQAYDNAQRTYGQQKNDAYGQAQVQAMGFAPQTQQMDIAGRDALLNELNAVRTGAQVQAPQFQGYTGSNVAPAPIFGATQAQGTADQNLYNAQMGASNSQNSGLYGLGGAAITAAAFF